MTMINIKNGKEHTQTKNAKKTKRNELFQMMMKTNSQ